MGIARGVVGPIGGGGGRVRFGCCGGLRLAGHVEQDQLEDLLGFAQIGYCAAVVGEGVGISTCPQQEVSDSQVTIVGRPVHGSPTDAVTTQRKKEKNIVIGSLER
jgi:hypothetical protein